LTSRAVRALLEDLRERDVRLEADGLSMHVDAPKGVLTEEDKQNLAENKQQLLKLLHRERKRLEEADRRGLVIRWSREPGWISLHDPTTGEWHEVKASECLPSIVESANKAHRRRAREQG
jgi:hypothetical protein